MVERITLFEPHFEGAQFGPSNFETDSAPEPEETDSEESSGGKSRKTMLVQGLFGFVLMFVVLYVSFRSLSSEDSES